MSDFRSLLLRLSRKRREPGFNTGAMSMLPKRTIYSPMPEGFDRRPMGALTQQFWLSRKPGKPILPRASLLVVDEDGSVLARIPRAHRNDFRLRVALADTHVLVDLYPWYLMWAILGGRGIYDVQQMACHTFVKFGECQQHKRLLQIRIAPARNQRTSR